MSSMTTGEYVKLVASFMSTYMPNYNCMTCLKKYKDPERQEKFQTSKGCFSVSKKPVTGHHFSTVPGSDRLYFYTCPGNFVNSAYRDLVMRHPDLEGYFPGSKSEQPAKFEEVKKLIGALKSEEEHTKIKEQDRLNGRISKR